jgi:hypothetical protein
MAFPKLPCPSSHPAVTVKISFASKLPGGWPCPSDRRGILSDVSRNEVDPSRELGDDVLIHQRVATRRRPARR